MLKVPLNIVMLISNSKFALSGWITNEEHAPGTVCMLAILDSAVSLKHGILQLYTVGILPCFYTWNFWNL